MSWFSKDLMRLGMIKFGKFKLSSGDESPYYIDLRRLYSYPEIAFRVIDELVSLIDKEYDAVAGVATAGIPLAAYIGFKLKIPMGYVRVEKKRHGLEGRVEGRFKGRKVLVVDDVATTGRSLASSVAALRREGASVTAAASVIDREQGAEELLKSLGVRLYSLVKVREIFKELLSEKLIDKDTYEGVMRYVERR